MKKTALLAAVAAAFVASPAFAAGGHVGLAYNSSETDTNDGDGYQLEGAIGGASGSVGYQFDAGIGNTDFDVGGDVDHRTIAGHLFWHTDSWNLGGVIATTNVEDDTTSADELVYGIEGTFNIAPNAVLGGSYTTGESEFLTIDIDTWNADVGLSYYFTDNFVVHGGLGTGNLDFGGGADFDTSSFDISGEWQMAAAPVSFRVGYSSTDTDVFGEYDTWSVGVRWNFGGTLRDRDTATPFETKTGLYQRAYGLQ